MKLNYSFPLLCAALIFLAYGCETDDIEPTITVSLTSDQPTIFEDGGSANVFLNLNADAPEEVRVQLLFTGSATQGADYGTVNEQVTIPEGSSSASMALNAIQDSLQEGDESIEVSIVSAGGAEISESENSATIIIEDDDVAATAQFILNEICYDPSNSGLDGDANGDGVYVQDDDSFIELYNPSSRDFDLSGFEIWDDTLGTLQYTFPANTIIPANKAIVIFGGGSPTGNFGGSTVLTAGGGFNFNNTGEVVGIKDPNGDWFLTFDTEPLSNNPNESYTRNPDITGLFEQHGDNTSVLFSPGTKIDGSPF